jgi:thiamine-monophosphate kinase
MLEALPQRTDAAGVDADLVRQCLLAGGDDYELAFSAPQQFRSRIEALADSLPLALTRIGSLEKRSDEHFFLIDAAGATVPWSRRGYDHFS